MKAIYLYRAYPNFVEIHVSRELPVFPKHHWRFRQPMPKVMLSRSADLEYVAALMANINTGNFRVELEDGRRSWREFLADLVFLEGVEMVVDVERFTLTAKVGRCFDAGIVCRSIARCIHQHFYPLEKLICESQLASTGSQPSACDTTTSPTDTRNI